jgi:hypothetical protein
MREIGVRKVLTISASEGVIVIPEQGSGGRYDSHGQAGLRPADGSTAARWFSSAAWPGNSHPVDRSTGTRFDQTLVLQGYQSAEDYPQTLRGIRYKDPEAGKRLLFITNNTALPALSTNYAVG